MKMLPILLILTLCPRINCEIEEDSSPDAVRIRSPRQVNTLLRKVSKPQMLELSVQTTIMSSYAFTAVSCTLINRHWAATPGHFLFHVPSAAFISNFTMIVGGRVFPSQAKAKEKMLMKKVSSDKTKKKSPSQSEGEMEVFEVTVLIPEWSRAVFLLSYEELLQRRLGRYEHVTRIQPMQLVSKLSVGVTIVEHKRIIHLEVFPLRNRKGSLSAWNGKVNGNAGPPNPTTIRQNETVCRISFTPNIAQQVKISTYGMLGDFIVQYDVERQMGIGDIQVLDGHFVHYFAPKDLPVVPKNVVFVIDTSASMIGTKIRQTKEALFTILHELRPNDHFNFVTFSNRIRVWQPGRLMPVSPNNIRDAKKFIYIITPSGGTDINAGIQAGSALLSDFLSSKSTGNRNSVSLIIFLTDGRPTIGVTQSPTIISNTKTAIQEKFCLFTVGLGEDVDYKLLKIMSLQNCGVMRRIPEDVDTSIMLRRFYHEIGTPLLSNIQVEYSDDAVEYVTQNLFVNYFNGSELVIAGRLTNRSADSLHIVVSASNGERRIVLEKDMSIHEREQDTQQRLAKDEPDVKRYVERLWGYLSTKDELKERLQSQTRSERETHIQRATNLSLTYGFLTPLTHLIVEKPLLLENGTVGNAVPKSGSSNQLPEDNGSLTAQTSVSARPSSTSSFSKLAKKSVVLSKTSADGDPHFVVDLPLSKLTVCFNINGKPGHVIRLLTDHRHSGVTVNAALIGAPPPEGSHKAQRTYFSSITIVADKPRRSYIEVNPQKIILDGLDRMILPVTSSISVESQNLAVVLIANTSLTVTIGRSMEFLILFHHYRNPAPYQRDHLGFYIANGEGLSGNTHGLLGQFLHQEIQLMEYPGDMSKTGGKWEAQGRNISALKVKDRTVPVMKKRRRIHFGKRTLDCWFARNNGAKLIEGHYKDYVVPHAFDTGDGFHGSNTA